MVLAVPVIAVSVLAIDDPKMTCIRQWDAPDYNGVMTYCNVPWESLMVGRLHIFDGLLFMVNFLNITFAFIFTKNLRTFVRKSQSATTNNTSENIKLEQLIVKNNVLVIIGCGSTSIGYGMYGYIWECGTLVVIDIFVNCLIIGLFFAWNHVYYQRLCGPCDRLCRHQCGYRSDSVAKLDLIVNSSSRSPSAQPTSPSSSV